MLILKLTGKDVHNLFVILNREIPAVLAARLASNVNNTYFAHGCC